MKNRLKIEEVAVLLGVSTQTVNVWYRFKALNPDNEYAKMLPDFEREGAIRQRFWHRDDIWKLLKFKDSIPHGRNGVLGEVTQKYCKGGKHYVKKANSTADE